MNSPSSQACIGHPIQRLLIRLSGWLRHSGCLDNPVLARIYRSLYFLYKGYWEDPYRTLTRQRPDLFQHGHILDIGANIGYNAALFAHVINPKYRVYAFEPEIRNFNALKALAAEGGIHERIIPIQSAVGDHEGRARLWINESDPSDHRLSTPTWENNSSQTLITQETPITTVDAFLQTLDLKEPISFIKLDIQGCEGAALRGMTQTLETNPKAAVGVEFCRSIIEALGFDPAEIGRFFKSHGYSVFIIRPWRPIKPCTFDELDASAAERGYVDLLFLPL